MAACYEKFERQQQKNAAKACLKDDKWEAVRHIVLARDNKRCRVWAVLTSDERAYILAHYRADFTMLQDLDCAHRHGRNAAPARKYDPVCIYTICRYFHGLLDTYKDPVTRMPLSKKEHDAWWQRISAGPCHTSPYGCIPSS